MDPELVRPGSHVLRIVAYEIEACADGFPWRFAGFVLERSILRTPAHCRPFVENAPHGSVPSGPRGKYRAACLCGWRGESTSWTAGPRKEEAARHAGVRWVLRWCVGRGRLMLEGVT